MSAGQRFQSFVIWALTKRLLGALLLLLPVYSVNAADQPPSETVLEFRASWDARPQGSAESNAYVYMMGISAPLTETPQAWGIKRIEWSQRSAAQIEDERSEDPGKDHTYRERRDEQVVALLDACKEIDSACLSAFENAGDTLPNWLESEAWLLERYGELITHQEWWEIVSPDVLDGIVPDYLVAMDGQRLWLAKLWMLAAENDAAGVKLLLEQDVIFWRRILASSYSTIGKLIAAANLKRHFGLANIALRQMPPEVALEAVPDAWRCPLSANEKSLARNMIGEWLGMNAIVRNADISVIESLQGKGGNGSLDANRSLRKRLGDVLQQHHFQPQNTSNRIAEYQKEVTEILDVPYGEMTEAGERAREHAERTESAASEDSEIYNRVGGLMFASSIGSVSEYWNRVADIEGIRQAALATLERRASNTPLQLMQQNLNNFTLRNPYNNEPFEWDESAGTVVFTGLAEDEKGRYSFLY